MLRASAIALVAGVLLLRRERGHPAPMLPVDLFKRPMFALSAMTAVCSFAAQGLAFVSLPFFFEGVLGRSQVETGFLMTPWSVLVALMAPIAGAVRSPSAGLLGGVGLAIMRGMVSLAMLPAQPHALDIGIRMAICGAGFGFFQSPNLKAFMASAPRERSGGASGMVATARLLGQATGAALVALCFSIAGKHGPTLALSLGRGVRGRGKPRERIAAGDTQSVVRANRGRSVARGVSALTFCALSPCGLSACRRSACAPRRPRPFVRRPHT